MELKQVVMPDKELWDKAKEIVKKKGFLWQPYISKVINEHCKKLIKDDKKIDKGV